MVQDSCFRNRTHFSVRGEKTLFVVCNGKANTRVPTEGALESTAALYYAGEFSVCEARGREHSWSCYRLWMLQLLTMLLVFLQMQEFVPRLLWAQCQCHIAPNLSALGQYLPFILACDLLLHLAAPCPAFSPVVLLLPYLLSGCLVSHHTYARVSWGHSPQYSPENPSLI